jgi:hypothetical protein
MYPCQNLSPVCLGKNVEIIKDDDDIRDLGEKLKDGKQGLRDLEKR